MYKSKSDSISNLLLVFLGGTWQRTTPTHELSIKYPNTKNILFLGSVLNSCKKCSSEGVHGNCP